MDCHWRNDMEEVGKLLKDLELEAVMNEATAKIVIAEENKAEERSPNLCKCCCRSHCSLSLHVTRGVTLVKQSKFKSPEVEINLQVKQPGWDYKVDKLEDFIREERFLVNAEDSFAKDSIMGLMTALNMDLS